MKLRNSENLWVLGIFLGITGLLAALILALVSQVTAEPIAKARLKSQMQVLRKLNLPEFNNNITADSITIDGIEFMAAKKDDKLVGFAAKGSNKLGYSGNITALVGFDAKGNILAVQILEHNETPGLGAVVCERKFQKTIFNFTKPAPGGLPPNPVLDQFHGKNAAKSGNWKISKDGGSFQFRTGATVTSRAVTALVNTISGKFAQAVKQFQESK